MRLTIKTEQEDGTVTEIVATVPDFLAWEKKTGKTTSEMATAIGMTDLAFLAWNAGRRKGLIKESLEKWAEGLVVLEPAGDDEARPTPPGASADSSSS